MPAHAVVKRKRKSEKRHSVSLRIRTAVTIPWNAKKGVVLELANDDGPIAAMRVTGALVHIRRAGAKKWIAFTIEDFLARLVG